ncbi:MAG: 6-phospho-3-hexuloisomerase [Candidatus Aenigmarchaeota archaeon]|nr:6-phospho-3-hexuloisomerase [Candidatus Aenigmarchaeota archaeon]
MSLTKDTVYEIIGHIKEVAEKISGKEIGELISMIIFSKRVFIFGAGRSGLVGKAFAVRLAHLKFEVFVVGDTITPAVQDGDLFIAISGSGETASVVISAKSAKDAGAKIAAVTSNRDSSLAKAADSVMVVEGRTKDDLHRKDYIAKQIMGRHEPLSPLGTLFEDTCQVLLDGVIVELMRKLRKTEDDLARMHSNVE